MSNIDLVGWCLGSHAPKGLAWDVGACALHSVRLDHRSLAPEILSTLYHPTVILTGSHWNGLRMKILGPLQINQSSRSVNEVV